jgi:hypothetical protein
MEDARFDEMLCMMA